MKNLSIVLNVVLLVAVGILYVVYFSGRNKAEQPGQIFSADGNVTAGIVYINTDTLLSKYLLSVELNEAFLKTQEERRTELNMKAKELDQQAGEFQRKIDNNGFLSRERAEEAQRDLMIKQQKLQKLQQEMTDKMMREQSELNKKLFDSITTFLAEYNKQKGYNIVLSTTLGGNVLYAEEGFDITGDVVRQLNEKYNNKKAE